MRPPTNRELIVLGIDPGTLVTGYGVVARSASGMRLLGCGTVKNDSHNSMPLRLKTVYSELCSVIRSFTPDECAIESAFYGKNAQSALKLGHARGVSILAAVLNDIPTSEYSPREVKRAVVGNGAASKEQVQFMVKSLLHSTQSRMLLDASDAIATALCHLHRIQNPALASKDWKSFVRDHPDRVRT